MNRPRTRTLTFSSSLRIGGGTVECRMMKRNFLVLVAAASCAAQWIATIPADAQQSSLDVIRVGDVLRVQVQNAPELSQNVQVDTEGNVFLPGVPGAAKGAISGLILVGIVLAAAVVFSPKARGQIRKRL